jgi:hypothetical protein
VPKECKGCIGDDGISFTFMKKGCYQSDEKILTDFQDEPVQAHVFEYTTSVHLVADKKA